MSNKNKSQLMLLDLFFTPGYNETSSAFFPPIYQAHLPVYTYVIYSTL